MIGGFIGGGPSSRPMQTYTQLRDLTTDNESSISFPEVGFCQIIFPKKRQGRRVVLHSDCLHRLGLIFDKLSQQWPNVFLEPNADRCLITRLFVKNNHYPLVRACVCVYTAWHRLDTLCPITHPFPYCPHYTVVMFVGRQLVHVARSFLKRCPEMECNLFSTSLHWKRFLCKSESKKIVLTHESSFEKRLFWTTKIFI